MKHVLAILFACIAFSCRTVKYVPIETIKSDTTYINKLQKDSVYIKDSVYVHSKGDTVYLNRYIYKYIDRLTRDTMYVSKVDSVQVPYPVEKELTKWQQIKLDVGGISLGVICLGIIILIAYFVKRFV